MRARITPSRRAVGDGHRDRSRARRPCRRRRAGRGNAAGSPCRRPPPCGTEFEKIGERVCRHARISHAARIRRTIGYAACSSASSLAAESTLRHAPALSRCASHAAVSASVAPSGRKRSPCADRPSARERHEARDRAIGCGQPKRQLGPWHDAVREKLCFVDPCGHHGGRPRLARDARARRPGRRSSSAPAGSRVVRALDARSDEIEHPLREIARVDELHARVPAVQARPHGAAPAQRLGLREACDPVGEAIGRVVRPDDQPRADDRRRARRMRRRTCARWPP